MLDIIRKINSYLVLSLLFLIVGCKEKDNNKYEIVFYTNTTKFTFFSNFYINERNDVFLFIDNNIKNKIEKENIKKIEIKTNSENYIALPINLFYSRERPLSNFVYTIDNKTKKIIIESIDNKSYIIIISEKTFIEDLVKSGIIKVSPLPR